uniref:Nucleotidyl transferase domain-containing protein n=1 Tax=viral metagenome TaxID=1070528 RepID=A0A6C0EST7_9ZZZZ
MKYIILCGGISESKSLPKPLNYIHGKYMIEYIIENIPSNDIYIFYNIFLEEYNFEEIIINLFKDKNFHFSKIDYLTRGPVETAYVGLKNFDNESILFIDNDNVHNIPNLNINQNFIGYGTNQEENHYSYIQIENGKVTNIEEKQKISDNYCCGIYGFKNPTIFNTYAEKVLKGNKINNEFFFSQIYKLMIKEHDIVPIFISYTKLIGNTNQLFNKPLRVCFDLDTLVTLPTIPNDFSSVKPIDKMICLLQQMKKMGHIIIIYTSRRMNTHKHNVGKVLKDIGLITFQTLEKYNIEYDEIIFGKPSADIYIDDKSINPYINDISYFGIETENDDFIHNKINNNKFNKIKKYENVIKKTGPYSILKGELNYYQNIPNHLSAFFPRLINFNKQDSHLELTMDYIKGIPLYYLYKNCLLTETNIDILFNILEEIHTGGSNINITISLENIHNNYFKKMKERFNNEYFFDDAEEIYQKVVNDLSLNFSPEIVGMIHGDFWFSNIILDYQDNYRLIDMKGQVNNILTLNGDKYYDYGKLYQSILGYDLVLNNVLMNKEYVESMKEIFLNKCKNIGLNINYLTAVTRSLMFGTIHFIESKETKKRVWDFIKLL